MVTRNYRKPTNSVHAFHAAKMLVAFQKRPGVAADRLISDAGAGIFRREGQKPVMINPVNGIYAIPLQKGETGTFELFDTDYTVASLLSGKETPLKKPSIINWQLPLEPVKSLTGIQQRLQILGYYTSSVDGTMGKLTERAVLEFQADEGTLLVDGAPGPKTQAALDTFFTGNGMDASGIPIIRRYLVSFRRGITGHAQWHYPHPDTRGGDTSAVSYFRITGGTWTAGLTGYDEHDQVFYFGMKRENLAPKSRHLYVTLPAAAGPDFEINPASAVIAPADTSLLSCIAKDTVVEYSEREEVQIRFGGISGPVIGEIDVTIVPVIHVKLYLHMLDVEDGFGVTVPNKWTLQQAKKLIDGINAIWATAGIEFAIPGSTSHKVIGKFAGTVTLEFDSVTDAMKLDESDVLWKNTNTANHINVYFSNELLWEYTDATGATTEANYDILGFACARKDVGPGDPIGICIKHSDDLPMLASTVAHELGHVLELTSHPHAHSDDDGTDMPFRHDSWSRSRLMAKYSRYDVTSPDRRWQDNGYGKKGNDMNGGAFLTIKKLKKDGTDDEFNVSRKAAKNGPY